MPTSQKTEHWQTVSSQIRRGMTRRLIRVMRRLIRVYTALTTGNSIKHSNNKNKPDTPSIRIELAQRVKVEEFTRHK